MIHLKEFKVKQILAKHKIRVPRGLIVTPEQLITEPQFPWEGGIVIKAQVPFSSRYKKGLICIEEDRKRVFSASREILTCMQTFGRRDEILFEELVKGDRQYYLAIVSDPVTRGPLLMFSQEGGVDIENRSLMPDAKLARLSIDILDGMSKERLREFFTRSGLTRETLSQQLIHAALTLFEIYREWNCHFIEINPLLETRDGLCALDAKMEVDEDAVFRMNPMMIEFIEGTEGRGQTVFEKAASRIDQWDYRGACHFVQSDINAIRLRHGNQVKAFVGFNGVGTGVSLTAMDELVRRGFYPRNFCDTSGNPPASKVYRATRIILSQDEIQGYFFISCVSSQQLHHTARGVIKAFKEIYAESNGIPNIPSLLLFRGAWEEEARQLFEEHRLTHSPMLRVLGCESSERDAVMNFEELFEKTRYETQKT